MLTIAGGHLKGCRIGFDLDASDYKVSAVIDGEAVFTEEAPRDPKSQANPEYHYHHIASALHRAAAHLPRVDAIGGSSAGIIVDNEIRVASLLRAVPKEDFPKAAGFINQQGRILGWLNELAFSPMDYSPAAAVDEWSGDKGTGVMYFSQQAVNKLLPPAKIRLPKNMGLPERLKEVKISWPKAIRARQKFTRPSAFTLGVRWRTTRSFTIFGRR